MSSREEIKVYQLNEEEAEFEELELDADVNYSDLFNSKVILLFIKGSIFRGWIWNGTEVSTRSKFIAAKRAPIIRDQISPAIRISAVDEGEEDIGLLVTLGLAEKPNEQLEQTGPSYTGTEEDEKELLSLSKEKILLLLEKSKPPEGYAREMIVYNNKIYSVNITEKVYSGVATEERDLVPLQYKIKDGNYALEGYIPNLLMSYNNVVMVELLRKMSDKELAAWKEKEKMMLEEAERKAKEAQMNSIASYM
jgi:hypothetical protein